MNTYTRVSDKGQVVVPKATRDRLGWEAGTALEVIERGDAVTLRRRRSEKGLSPDAALERFRSLYQHAGPAITPEQMDEAVAAAAGARDRRRG